MFEDEELKDEGVRRYIVWRRTGRRLLNQRDGIM